MAKRMTAGDAGAEVAQGGLTRRALILGGATVCGTLSCSRARPAAGGPRARGVVLLVADDLGRRDLGLYGKRAPLTPAIDALATAGARLDRAYTTTAICRPSRASILSGLYPHNTGRAWYGEMREGLDCWPEHFRRGGVFTGSFGKTTLTREAERWDFCEGSDLDYGPGRDPATFAEAARRFLDRAGDRPFAFMVGFFDPHRTTAAEREEHPLKVTRAELDAIEPPPYLPPLDPVKLEVRTYYRDIERLDRSVAAVLGVLAERGLADATLVAFTSDNGAAFPFAKGTLHEAGVNLPLLVRWPGQATAGVVHDGLVSFIDLLPTFMEVLGLAPPEDIDGRSFLPLLLGSAAVHRDAIFCEHDEDRDGVAVPSRAVIEARYKYVRHFKLDRPFENESMRTLSGMAIQQAAREDPGLEARWRRLTERPRAELLDLAEDPWELVDRAGDPALAQVEAGLAERLRGWMREEGDVLLGEWDA